jgi:hypothetical protein
VLGNVRTILRALYSAFHAVLKIMLDHLNRFWGDFFTDFGRPKNRIEKRTEESTGD